jgi:hypothetical protein
MFVGPAANPNPFPQGCYVKYASVLDLVVRIRGML